MPYQAPVSEYQFIFDQVVPLAPVVANECFSEATQDLTDAVLNECGKMCDTVMAPLQRPGDLHPAKLENGVVRTPPGFADGYAAIAESGWVGISATPEHGGMGLPMALNTAMHDMMCGACISLNLCPLLSQGQIEALEHHANADLQALYLPKLISGEWTGTMNLTEPHAGSDVGALSSKAEPQADGSYKISGQKIFITWGEHDVAENICHLVLARLPGAKPGPKGISLFLVPKFIPHADGSLGARNDLRCVSLEHKLGIHGSPTAVMEFSGATGWLVGEEHNGMACMFTMMNNARLAVGDAGRWGGRGRLSTRAGLCDGPQTGARAHCRWHWNNYRSRRCAADVGADEGRYFCGAFHWSGLCDCD
jgi:alkylation response protein AidB-like acyl-CoA dehydrogenase